MGVLRLLTGALLLIYFTTTVTPRLHGKSFRASPTIARLPKATPTPECIDTVTCGSAKFVAKCVTCRPEYFYCPTPGGPPILEECTSDMVFNPDPNYPKCILKSNCPYHPPWTLPPTPPPPTTAPPATTTAAVVTTAAPTTAAGSTIPGTTGPTAAPGNGTTAAPATTTAGPATTPQATTTAAPTPTPECVDSLTCPASGFYAQCVTCQPTFFQCAAAGSAGVLRQCSSGMVFNTDPAFRKCVLASNCPYHPQF
ncbi:mucin-2-like [Macrobrachium nipponense]|uniref:mucin-2-like n=1 Tax=Macrobrachium nipponense TaxID=159736 RepID=UPI0030C86C13